MNNDWRDALNILKQKYNISEEDIEEIENIIGGAIIEEISSAEMGEDW